MSKLTVRKLEEVVQNTLKEEGSHNRFRAEVTRVLGPTVIVEAKIGAVAENAGYKLDVMDRSGRTRQYRTAFNSNLMATFLDHTDPRVRRFAARIVPEKFLDKMRRDASPIVRSAVAARSSTDVVREMMKKFPDDDQLRVLYRKRASAAKPLAEAGIPQPKKAEVSQVTDAKRMGAAGKQSSFPELSDAWYYSKARKLIQDYGGNLEYNWEKLAVDRFCKNMHLTSKIEVDDKKLYDTLMKMIDDSNDRSMKRDELKETIEALEKQALIENTESYYEMEEVNETPDPVRTLAESKISHGSYVEKAERLFNVRHSIAPASLAKYYQGEGKLCETKLPVVCRLPHTEGFRQIDEKALDRYCEAWNAVQESNGEPVKIDWSVHPDDTNGKVSFKAILR